MIQKAQIGRGFRGVLTYVFDESAERGHDRARIVDTNMAGETPRELAAEFGVFRRLNPDLTRAVYHCSLRLPAEEWLPQADWQEFCRDYLAAMGFGASPYVVVQHADDHVHIVASRVQFDGRTVPDSNDRWRSNQVIHALEEKHDLAHARDPERARARQPQVSRDEVALAARVGEVPPKFVLAARIDAAVAHSDGTRAGFDAVLDRLGVTAHWNIARTGRVHGASYALRDYQGAMGAVCKGSQVGKGYGWGRLAERLEERRGEHAREGHTGGTDARAAQTTLLGAEYRARATWLAARYPEADRSRIDGTVMRDVARTYPTADAGMLMAAMRAGSPGLAERTAGQGADYLARTVGTALATPDVVAARRETRARDDGRDDR